MRINLHNLYKLDTLLEICKGCEKNQSNVGPEIRCKGCSNYTEIRAIGESLGRKKKMAKLEMTVDEFIELKEEQKLTHSKIAQLKGVSEAAIYYWQNKRQGQINMALGKTTIPSKETLSKGTTAEKKPSESKPSPKENNDKKAEYEALINELKVKLADSEHGYEIREKVVAKLEEQVAEAGALCKSMNSEIVRLRSENEELKEKVRELESLHAACDDVESELDSLREEKNSIQWEHDKLKLKEYQQSYTIENQRKRIGDLGKTLERYEKENKALRELVALWI